MLGQDLCFDDCLLEPFTRGMGDMGLTGESFHLKVMDLEG